MGKQNYSKHFERIACNEDCIFKEFLDVKREVKFLYDFRIKFRCKLNAVLTKMSETFSSSSLPK